MLLLGYATRGQAAVCGGRWATIQKIVTEVDGELFVVIKFGDGTEKLVSVGELSLVVKRDDRTRSEEEAST